MELDGDMGSSRRSSAQAQKSRTRSPGVLKAGAQLCICEEREERLGSQPKCLPIATAMPGVGAWRAMISHGTRCSGDDVARESTE